MVVIEKSQNSLNKLKCTVIIQVIVIPLNGILFKYFFKITLQRLKIIDRRWQMLITIYLYYNYTSIKKNVRHLELMKT
jgi:hypothetical protein